MNSRKKKKRKLLIQFLFFTTGLIMAVVAGLFLFFPNLNPINQGQVEAQGTDKWTETWEATKFRGVKIENVKMFTDYFEGGGAPWTAGGGRLSDDWWGPYGVSTSSGYACNSKPYLCKYSSVCNFDDYIPGESCPHPFGEPGNYCNYSDCPEAYDEACQNIALESGVPILDQEELQKIESVYNPTNPGWHVYCQFSEETKGYRWRVPKDKHLAIGPAEWKVHGCIGTDYFKETWTVNSWHDSTYETDNEGGDQFNREYQDQGRWEADFKTLSREDLVFDANVGFGNGRYLYTLGEYGYANIVKGTGMNYYPRHGILDFGHSYPEGWHIEGGIVEEDSSRCPRSQ